LLNIATEIHFIEEVFAMMWGDWTMNGFGMWGGIMMLVFWIAVIVGVVLLVKWVVDQNRTTGRRRDTDESPLEILQKRYASGEITKEEFEQKRIDLSLAN